jgi:thiamine biosynthesis lipoprotein
VLTLTGCFTQETSRFEFALGTVCSIDLFEHGKTNVYNDVFTKIREIENLMSVNISTSDISLVNASAGIKPVQVHEDTFKVIKRAVYFAEVSNGAFDPTVGPLVSLWGINSGNPKIPSQEEIDAVLPLINWRFIELNHEKHSVFLTQYGMMLDLGGIAKGYAADEAAKIIKNAGIKRAKIDLGGNIIMLGERKDERPWRVGIQNPAGERGSIIGTLQITEKTIVTSGVYERSFEKDGIYYHHIFSPQLGYPVQNDLLSVTLVSDNSMDADALSTALFVLGYEQSSALLESMPGEVIFVFEDNSIRKSTGVDFTLTDKTFFLFSPR